MNIPGYTYITHKLIQRPWGPECRFTVSDPAGVHVNEVVAIPSMEATEVSLVEIISARLARMKAIGDREATFSKAFDNCGPELKQAIFWMVRKIRANPTATLAQATTAWNAEWADSLFTFDKLVAFVQREAGNVTWAQFRTYVINHNFRGID